MTRTKWTVGWGTALLVTLSFVWGDGANATLFGSNGKGRITSVDGKPALCLPKNAEDNFPLASFSISESYLDHSGSWGGSLKPGRQPILLKPGDCIVFGRIPAGYIAREFGRHYKTLELKPNRTYVFQINRAYQYATVYNAVFCTMPNASGGFDYLQYVRLPVNMKITPSCDARLNGNAPEPVHPLIYPR